MKIPSFIFLAAFLLLAPVGARAAEDSPKPNIVVFLADDLGRGDPSPCGHPEIKTPNLAPLAAQGVKFNPCCSAPGVCSPSRSAIPNGRTPYRNGVWLHLSGNNEAHLRRSEITCPKLLQAAGHNPLQPRHSTP